VAGVQALGALQIPFYLGGILVVRLLSALKANHILMWISFVNMIVNIIADYVLMRIYGVLGISFSTSVVYFISFSMLVISVSVILGRNRLNAV
jgi:putative peptidoglycan lipid II flippase